MLRICSLLVSFALAGPAAADLSGPVHVIDGDTVIVAGEKVRLHGIDSPEEAQHCGGPSAPTWACGEWVKGEVSARYDGRRATCDISRGKDRYGRWIGVCHMRDGDLARALVRGGLAFAYPEYSDAYLADEDHARARRAGLHAAFVQSPDVFRDNQKRAFAQTTLASAPDGCVIKGNISKISGERIYHMPGQDYYNATVISPSDGERWFCKATDALSAGWRASYR